LVGLKDLPNGKLELETVHVSTDRKECVKLIKLYGAPNFFIGRNSEEVFASMIKYIHEPRYEKIWRPVIERYRGLRTGLGMVVSMLEDMIRAGEDAGLNMSMYMEAIQWVIAGEEMLKKQFPTRPLQKYLNHNAGLLGK
jgi:hypothetical protein